MSKSNKPLLALAAFIAPAVAYAESDATPADADCDLLSGQAKGLCTAYCGPLDCSSDPGLRLSDKACAKLAERFFSETGLNRFPCDEPAEQCTVIANDDELFAIGGECDSVNIFDNDQVTPASAQLYWDNFEGSEVDYVTLDQDGTAVFCMSETMPALSESYTVTVCCDEGYCDTSLLTIIGS